MKQLVLAAHHLMKRTVLSDRTWVVIPGYNESKYISAVLKEVRRYTEKIVVVDDGSQDTMAKLASKQTAHVLQHPVNMGKGAALKTGCDYAFFHQQAESVIVMDSDGQHNPSELQLFQAQLTAGNQVVFGVRPREKGMPWIKRLSNALASILIWMLFGKYLPDIPCGYKAFTKKAYKSLRWTSTGYHVEMEIAARVAVSNLKSCGVQVELIYLDPGKGMTIADVLDMLGHVLVWRVTL